MAVLLIDHDYLKEIEKARRELRALIYKEQCAPIMLRLAWQDAATYDPGSKMKGGPDGSIRTEQLLKRPENKGLDKAVHLCEEVRAKLKKVSYADLYQLAGVVAVEATGGPTIHFLPGRMDSDDPPPEGRLPDPHEKGVWHLREIFTTRMGLSDQDIVALSGGHTLGEAHKQNSVDGKWTEDPSKFDNSYFKNLLKKGKFSLATDNAPVEDKKFFKYVRKYAKDKDAFFKDYAAAHKKLSELGCNLENPFMLPKVPDEKLKLIRPKGVIGMVLVSAVILGYFRKRKNTN